MTAPQTPSNSSWSSPEIVARLSATPPNVDLMRFASDELQRGSGNRLLDIGCGAGCNAVPLAQMGWEVLGLDLSEPMLDAAQRRIINGGTTDRLRLDKSPMDRLPVNDQAYDFIVAHGIWNLARSGNEFRMALREAARAARPGAALFVYTFSRNTLPADAETVEGETFVFTQFSGRPQCFLTEEQLIEELDRVGFRQEAGNPVREYPRVAGNPKPAIYEGIFRRRGQFDVVSDVDLEHIEDSDSSSNPA